MAPPLPVNLAAAPTDRAVAIIARLVSPSAASPNICLCCGTHERANERTFVKGAERQITATKTPGWRSLGVMYAPHETHSQLLLQRLPLTS